MTKQFKTEKPQMLAKSFCTIHLTIRNYIRYENIAGSLFMLGARLQRRSVGNGVDSREIVQSPFLNFAATSAVVLPVAGFFPP